MGIAGGLWSVKPQPFCLFLGAAGVQHVQQGLKYPAVLCVAGWNDPRVAPWEPGKFAATLQNASTSGKPVFLKVNYDNGHFTEEKIVTFKNFASQFAFLRLQDTQSAGVNRATPGE